MGYYTEYSLVRVEPERCRKHVASFLKETSGYEDMPFEYADSHSNGIKWYDHEEHCVAAFGAVKDLYGITIRWTGEDSDDRWERVYTRDPEGVLIESYRQVLAREETSKSAWKVKSK